MTLRTAHRLLSILPVLLVPALSAQQADCWKPPAPGDPARTRAADLPRVARAFRIAGSPPQMDGRLDDPAWCAAPPLTDFVQTGPNPGALSSLPSVARVLFDDQAIYVAVRLFDPAPDSIVAPFPRRDDENTSDWVFVEIDTRFDHRSGFSFGVNPRGVQVDGTWANDVDYDPAWNGVWQSAATIDSLGWTAVYRIEFSQLALGRGTPGSPLTWGINVYRYSPHRGESSNWSPRLPSVVGIVSHFNQLEGLEVPPRRGAAEAVVYGAVTGQTGVSEAAGADLTLRPTSNSTVALSLHPDFGQVEADPSQINLTTFETFLPEQRPLFVEGAEVFQFPSALAFASRGTSFDLETPFYSRRIGRDATLLGAGRASLHSDGGWSGGVFQAWTNGPLTSFSVLRATHDMDQGQAAVGVMATSVDRYQLDLRNDSLLPRHAEVFGTDARSFLWGGKYEVTGFALLSRVAGSAPAITLVRRDPRHGYSGSDTLGTSLVGATAQAQLARVDGRLLWSVASRLVTRGFESNDIGFQRNADWMLVTGSWKYLVYRPGNWLRRWSVGSSQVGAGWTTGGRLRAAALNATATADLRSYWGATLSLDHEFAAADPEVLRGGPPLPLPPRNQATLSVHSDSRRRWGLTTTLSAAREPGSGSWDLSFTPDFAAFVTDRIQLGFTPSLETTREGWQYVDQAGGSRGTVHYVLGDLRQNTASVTARATYAFSPYLTIQLYSQGFLSTGRYPGFSEAVTGRVLPLGTRVNYVPDSGAFVVDSGTPGEFAFANPAFADHEFHLNLLLRWEFQPGSTLFVVWTQARSGLDVGAVPLSEDASALWRTRPENTLAVKLSYRLAR